MYVCGMTVYDYCHLGHARMLVVFDTVYRYLKVSGYEVTYIRNITDIDDKIIKRALENGETIQQLTGRFIDAMHEDTDALLIERPTAEPRATDTIAEILDMISTLVEKKHAYQADNGDVYYSVESFAGYGKLSGKRREDLLAGARVDIDENKRDPLDFVLWKATKAGEPSWPSPWGDGRPGWHIECSAMSTAKLGAHFDIHGGGQDLQFPHHENEIAQSEACTGHKYVNYWIHNGFVRVNEEKMSKSLGNFFTVRDILKHYAAEEVRFFILNSHYRSALNYSDEQIDNARAALTRLYTALRGCGEGKSPSADFGASYRGRFTEAMDDDFNTPEAIAVLFDLAREINRLRDQDMTEAASAAALLRELAGILGLMRSNAEDYLRGTLDDRGLSADDIEKLIAQRTAARTNRNWAESDRIRDLLKAQGVVLEDSATGTSWRSE
jgi:cysteinyl-tRNA synthetase